MTKAGSLPHFESAVQQYAPRLLATAGRILGTAEDAQDAVQEALVSAWRAMDRFQGASSMYTWLHRIVVNECLERIRGARRRGEVSMATEERAVGVSFEGIPPAWSRPGPNLETRLAMRRALERALASLPGELRTVLILRDVEDLSSKEVAELTGVNDATVRQRLHRARTAMAEVLRPELCEGPELTCGGQFDLLMDYIDRELPADLESPVHEHIHGCADCGELLTGYRVTTGFPRAVAELSGVEALDDAWVRAVLERVRTMVR